MTDRLYYRDSFLYDFDVEIREVVESPRPGLILNRSALRFTRALRGTAPAPEATR